MTSLPPFRASLLCLSLSCVAAVVPLGAAIPALGARSIHEAPEETDPPPAGVVLSRRGEAGGWRAVYQLPRPVDRLRFERKAAYHREEVWTVRTPGWEWARAEDGAQILRPTASGRSTSEVVFTFPTHDENLPKEYELFQTFSDGSVAVYSGHFHATAESVEGGEAIAVRTLRLEPPAGGHLAAGGELFREPTEWTDPRGHDGTYLYLGSIEPVETEHVLALLDPGLPEWVLERLHEDIPLYFAAYTKRLGAHLPWKPMVLLSFSRAETAGYSSGGGTLSALVQMSIRGEAWRASTPDTERHLGYLFAHETAHLWNGQLVTYPGSSESWLHEGSADAFAHRLLREREIISPEADRARLARRLTECARGLSEGALDDAAERGEFHLYYECGEIVAWWTELVLPEREDLFSFWRDLINVARERGGTYDQELYFSRLRELGGSEESIRRLRRFVSEPLEDPFEFLLRWLPRAGWSVREAKGRPPEAERRALVRPVIQELMAASCDGRFSFSQHPDGFVLHPLEGCSGLDRERTLRSIQGNAVLEDGDRARRAARETCARGGAVELGFAGDTPLELACEAEIPPAPRRFAVEATPTAPSPARECASSERPLRAHSQAYDEEARKRFRELGRELTE